MSDAVYCIALDAGKVVIQAVASNCPQPGMTEVPIDVFAGVLGYGVGRCTFDGATVAAYAPPVPATPSPTVTGNQWAFALSDMGLAAAWRIGKTKSKDSDQTRLELIARDTPLVASDPLLIRVAANAGLDASGNALISVPAVFLHAQGMPT